MSAPVGETPYSRLRSLFSYAFTKVDYDDPNVPSTPEELKEFGTNTVFIMGAGLLFGGLQQWWRERGSPPPIIPSGYSTAERAKFLGEINTRRLIRLVRSSVRGGMWCGWMGALYFGVEGLAAYARQIRDPWNTVLGAWACGAVFGFAVGGPGVVSRLGSTAGAVFLAGLAGYPAGFVNVALNDMLRSQQQGKDAEKSELARAVVTANAGASEMRHYPVRDYDVVGAVIGKLDKSLQDTDRFK